MSQGQKLMVWAYLDKLFDNVKEQMPVDGIEHLQELVLEHLTQGVCIFYFTKEDGTVRQAVGTLKTELLPARMGDKDLLVLTSAMITAYDTLKELKKPKEERDTEVMLNYKNLKGIIQEAAELSAKFHIKLEKSDVRKKSVTTQAFYDLQAQSWKAYNTERLVGCIEL